MTMQQLTEAGRSITRAFDMLDRAAEYCGLHEAALITKRGLLDEARRQVDAARSILER